jgi:hypothetical protein
MQQMSTITTTLKGRLFELQTNYKAKNRAEDLARRRENERKIQALTQQVLEKRTLFTQLLSTVFRKWTARLWRVVNGFIFKNEMVISN